MPQFETLALKLPPSEMPPNRSTRPSLGSLPAGRTSHACAQCRHRKHKCGGFTDAVRCRPCTVRKVRCSFQDEIMEIRHNPYLCLTRPPPRTQNENLAPDGPDPDTTLRLSPESAALMPSLVTLSDAAALHDPVASMPEAVIEDSAIVNSSNVFGADTPDHVRALTSRIADLERRLNSVQYSNSPRRQDQTGNSQTRVQTSLRPPTQQQSPSYPVQQHGAPSPAHMPTVSAAGAYSFSSSPGDVMTEGPLKTLNRFEEDSDSLVEVESNDPITRSILSQAEAHVIFKIFFSNCHPHAPFLDAAFDSNPDHLRTGSILLFLAILSIGARFWSAPSRISCWLHPRYSELVRLLDAEIMRVTLRPRQKDHTLQTVQALILYAHWMPLDISSSGGQYHSRFSEAGAWHCMGLAIRWAVSLDLEKACCDSFQHPEKISRLDARSFRTLLYLYESDCYLALSARRPSSLNPEPLNQVLTNFNSCKYVQPTDKRLVALFQIAHCAHLTDCRPTTTESVEAFDRYVQLVEQDFNGSHDHTAPFKDDSMSRHFPFTSLRWYRLSYTCAFLDSAVDQNQTQTHWVREALSWAIGWASQIILHLSTPLARGGDATVRGTRLNPDPGIVHVMAFTIDHYYVVISYAVFLLVNSWLRNLIDYDLHECSSRQQPENATTKQSSTRDPCSSLLYRLVDLAARTLEEASPPQGHLARRYVPLLRGMADIVASHDPQHFGGLNLRGTSVNVAGGPGAQDAGADMNDTKNYTNLDEDIWGMWRQAGLEPINWPIFPDFLDLQGNVL